ncbi:DUF6923 family protein [Prauserella flavalba]|uniref:DUF6923 domain-containing protein n=1 Tax=Prauserella flavalba TaxID=1477506 RepID=A0A318LLR3_9PSEU|nr:hypothetical protein [Prauserella flavalba]PXY35586.1 hypothetical protein BA062_08755 [Prauserella flavalba]
MRARWPPVVLALPLALAVPVIDAAPARPEQAFACSMLRVETDWLGDGSRLSRVDLPGGEVTPIGVLDVRVNAIGYSREQELAYGVSGGHVVTFDRLGDLTVAGELPDAPGGGGPVRPTSAAVSGAGWYLLDDEVLYTVDIDPASPDYLRVTQAMPLVPGDLAGEFDDIDDIDFDPRTGLLYGVAADYPRSRVVRIDPGSGAASAVPGLALPPSTAYGAVALGPDGVLYATANVAGGRSRLYRAELDGTGKVTELSSGPVLRGSDATACLVIPGPDPAPPVPPPTTRPAPPTPEPPPPEPPPAPPPSPRPAPPPVPPREQPPPSPREPPQSPPLAAPEPAPPAPPPAAAPPPPPEEQAQSDDPTPTEKKRRWALTMLLIAFGAGAAARSMRRR